MKAQLAAVSTDSVIMNVFIILAVVVAASLVFYFAWDAIAALANKNKSNEPKQQIAQKSEHVNTKGMDDFDLDAQDEKVAENAEEKTENKAEAEPTAVDKGKMTEVDKNKAVEEKQKAEKEASEQEKLIAERRAFLEAKRQELIRRMQSDAKKEEIKQEIKKEEEKEAQKAPEVKPEAKTEVKEEKKDNLDEERKALVAQKERYDTLVKELESAKKQLEKEKTTVTVQTKVVPTNGVLSLDELKAKLAEAEEKQKITDKEFKQCKKEFTPLHKVWTTHERDERKLRRKEALVAKQKVLLYGVNNYADIDEEKAKKLAEDLDLLDGLKLSVQHCEEVMEKNAERYPLLEKMFTVLKKRNDELKADIEYYKAEIEKLENSEENPS